MKHYEWLCVATSGVRHAIAREMRYSPSLLPLGEMFRTPCGIATPLIDGVWYAPHDERRKCVRCVAALGGRQ